MLSTMGRPDGGATIRRWGHVGSCFATAFAWFALPAIGILNVVAVAMLPIRLTDPLFTHPSTSAAAASAALIAGVALLASGLITTAIRAASALGSLAILASIAWFAPDWIGWQDAPPIIRSLAMVGAWLLAPIVLHLVAAGSGALRGSSDPNLVVAAYVVTIALAVSRAVVGDPIRDLDCLEPPRNCTENVFLLWADQDLARPLILAQFGVAIVDRVELGGHRRIAAPHGDRSGATIARANADRGCRRRPGGCAYLVAAPTGRLLTAAEPVLAALFMVRAGAVTALAVALVWTVARRRRISASVARLASDLVAAPAPGGLEGALALSLGDPHLTVAYRLPAIDSFVDANGMAVPAGPARPGRAATPILRNGNRSPWS